MEKSRETIFGMFQCLPLNMSIRSKVLSSFKSLHRTRLKVFGGDEHALAVTRDKINTEYRKNTDETDTAKLDELLQIAIDSERLLRTTVVQGQVGEDNVMRVKITKEKHLEDNAPYGLKMPPPKGKRKKCSDNPS